MREFYKCHYELELTRKTDLTAALAIPIGVLSLLAGGLILMAKELHSPLSPAEKFIAAATAVSTLAVIVSVYFLVRSLYNFAYGYIATPLEIRKFQADLVTFHEGEGMSAADARELAEEEVLEYINGEYAFYADRNAKNNDIKSSYLHRANGAMIMSVIGAGVAGAAYVYNSVQTPAAIPKVQVVNLKEAFQMIHLQPIQAASTPPPPPPPPRPSGPPGRVVREHQSPPRPPAPPPSR